MSEIATIKPRDNASNKVTGPARIVDMEGSLIREVASGESVFLCRCGHSQDKPFCDESHKTVGFESVVRASDFPTKDVTGVP